MATHMLSPRGPRYLFTSSSHSCWRCRFYSELIFSFKRTWCNFVKLPLKYHTSLKSLCISSSSNGCWRSLKVSSTLSGLNRPPFINVCVCVCVSTHQASQQHAANHAHHCHTHDEHGQRLSTRPGCSEITQNHGECMMSCVFMCL